MSPVHGHPVALHHHLNLFHDGGSGGLNPKGGGDLQGVVGSGLARFHSRSGQDLPNHVNKYFLSCAIILGKSLNERQGGIHHWWVGNLRG